MDKWMVQSKTLWGVLLLALPGLSATFNWNIAPSDLAGLEPAMASLVDSAEVIVGIGLAVWGRLTAKTSLTVTPPAKPAA
jgi:hypothetical protein